MNNILETTGKTLEEALESAVKELGVTIDDIEYEISEEIEKKSFFGLFGSSKQITVKVKLKEKLEESTNALVLDEDPVVEDIEDKEIYIDRAKEFLSNIFAVMGIDVLIEKFNTSDNITKLNLHGENLGILIGKHGQTLDSLQYLTNLAINKDREKWFKVVLDIANYRQKRLNTLTRLARRLAEKARKKNERIVLEPMSPNERKIIHMALQNDKKIVTFSEGDEPFRHVVIMQRK